MKLSDNWARMRVLSVALFGGAALWAHGADGERSATNSALVAVVADGYPTTTDPTGRC